MSSVDASEVDWPSNQQKLTGLSVCKAQGARVPSLWRVEEMARGTQRRRLSLPAQKIMGGFMEEVVSGWGLEGWALNPPLPYLLCEPWAC